METEKALNDGVYFVKDEAPVKNYEEGVDTDRLLVIGKYCQLAELNPVKAEMLKAINGVR